MPVGADAETKEEVRPAGRQTRTAGARASVLQRKARIAHAIVSNVSR